MPESLSQSANILIVDDTSKNIQVLASILSEHKYQIKAATSGVQALSMIEKQLPDIILLDIMMPEMDGFETCKRLKSSEATKNIPVIFLTAKLETEDVVKGFELGAVDYITKPFNPHELIVRVKNHLDLKRSKDIIEKISFERKELIHILSHDLINSMGVCITTLEMGKGDPDFLNQMSDNMLSALQNGVDLVNMVKQMRALEENKLLSNVEPVSLKLVITEASHLINDKLTKKNITLEIDIPEDIEILVERITFINSVCLNVITNAIKFSFPDSAIQVKAVKTNNDVKLSITDHGIGIPKDMLDDIFDMSKATSRAGTENEKGTGFGMPLVKKFITAFGGEIIINSKEKTDDSGDHGTEIILTLKSSS